jgi:hypothetical protein
MPLAWSGLAGAPARAVQSGRLRNPAKWDPSARPLTSIVRCTIHYSAKYSALYCWAVHSPSYYFSSLRDYAVLNTLGVYKGRMSLRGPGERQRRTCPLVVPVTRLVMNDVAVKLKHHIPRMISSAPYHLAAVDIQPGCSRASIAPGEYNWPLSDVLLPLFLWTRRDCSVILYSTTIIPPLSYSIGQFQHTTPSLFYPPPVSLT